MELGNNTVLITGGGSGIGLEMAKAFAKAGSNVLITGRNEQKLINATDTVDGLSYQVVDVTNQNDIDALYDRLKKEGGLDILVNNAGVFVDHDYTGSENSDALLKEIDTNFAGPVRMVNTFLPLLFESKEPAIINVSSGLAFVPLTTAPVYCGTKAAMHSWTRSLRFQLSPKKVKVFELMPPLVATDMTTQYKEFKPISTGQLIDGFKKSFKKNQLEITPGQSKSLRMMSRFAPNFIFKQVNKTFSKAK